MRVAVIQGTTRRNMNSLLFESVKKAVQSSDEALNFGIFEEENEEYSYVEIAMMISLLIESGAVDFVVTGCSSGQGMMLACNSLPGLLCGYIETPTRCFPLWTNQWRKCCFLAIRVKFWLARRIEPTIYIG